MELFSSVRVLHRQFCFHLKNLNRKPVDLLRKYNLYKMADLLTRIISKLHIVL